MTAPQVDPLLRPGAIVGEYEITHLLGEGGMGVVYAAIHPEIGKRVAIKVLAPHAAQHPDLIRRFKEEARAVNKIRHPNIIDIFAFNQLADGRHYFVMEYLDGESLTARLEQGSTPLLEMRRLLAQMCSALQAAHEAGVIHRDLKPDNVWIATQHLAHPEVKLLDFGIAKLADTGNVNATQTGAAIGTPHYMAPEQAMGRPLDHRADIYALGVVLYQIFTGTLPFDGATVHEIVFKHVTEAPRPPSAVRPIVPPGMETIILDCLQKEPALRPRSMRELGERIELAFAAYGDVHPEAGALMAPRARASTTLRAPTPARTELLSEPSRAAPLSVGETLPLAAAPRPSDIRFPGDGRSASGGWPERPKRRWVWPLAGVALLGLSAVAVEAGLLRRVLPGPSVPAQPDNARSTGAPFPSRPTVEPPGEPAIPHAAPAESAPPVAAGVQAAPPRALEPAPPGAAARHEQRRKPARKPAPSVAHAAKPSKAHDESPTDPAVPAAPKPNCNPNFYLDAQGDKHFKPECF